MTGMTGKKSALRAGLLAALLCLAPGAGQGLLAAGGQSAFNESDQDGNGTLDHEEFRHRMVETFYLLDKNGDGHLTMNEISGAPKKDFTAADRNGDRRLAMKEFLVIRFLGFKSADRNGDGVLSQAEVKAVEARQ